jgi:hypothetical protein
MKDTTLPPKKCAKNFPLTVLLPVLQVNALNATKDLLSPTENAPNKSDKIQIAPDKIKTKSVFLAEISMNLSMEIVFPLDKILSASLVPVNAELESVSNAKRDISLTTMEYAHKSLKIVKSIVKTMEAAQVVKKNSSSSRANAFHQRVKRKRSTWTAKPRRQTENAQHAENTTSFNKVTVSPWDPTPNVVYTTKTSNANAATIMRDTTWTITVFARKRTWTVLNSTLKMDGVHCV